MQGSGCHQEAELRGKLRGFEEAFKTARLIKDKRFQELFEEAHLEVFGMTSAAKTLAIGVAAQQLTMNDWERFDAPEVKRCRSRPNMRLQALDLRGEADRMLVIHVHSGGEFEALYYGDFQTVKDSSRYSARDNKQSLSISKLKKLMLEKEAGANVLPLIGDKS